MIKLKLITTPIGNLDDLTPRAKLALESSTLVLAEDTRTTRNLFDLLEIPVVGRKFMAFHDHSQKQIDSLLHTLKSHDECCIVSDAGSPIISDPAYPLVRAVIDAGGEVVSVPGVTSVVTALEMSALPPQPYTFHGFLGRKKSEIANKLDECTSFGGTHIFFESPHRIESTLDLLATTIPNNDVAICREITKKFESVYRFKARDWKSQEINVKGEFVVVIHFDKTNQTSMGQKDLKKFAEGYLKKKTPKNLAKLLAPALGITSSEAYSLLTDQ